MRNFIYYPVELVNMIGTFKMKFKIQCKQSICTQIHFSEDQSLKGSSLLSAGRFRSSSQEVHGRVSWVSLDLYSSLLPTSGTTLLGYELDEDFGKPFAIESPRGARWTRNRPTSVQKIMDLSPRNATTLECGQGSSFP